MQAVLLHDSGQPNSAAAVAAVVVVVVVVALVRVNDKFVAMFWLSRRCIVKQIFVLLYIHYFHRSSQTLF